MKRGTPDHPKVAALAAAIDQPIYAAVGLLELLWHFTAQFCPRGNIGKYPDKSICAALKWGKSRQNLVEVLIRCGFLEVHSEHRLIVHDWKDHADQAVERKLARHGESFVTSQRLAPELAVPVPVPVPVPSSRETATQPPGMVLVQNQAVDAVETVQDWLGQYMELSGIDGWGRPDFKVAEQILYAIDGAPLDDWGRFLLNLSDRKQRPESSWAWFVSVTKSNFKSWRASNGITTVN